MSMYANIYEFGASAAPDATGMVTSSGVEPKQVSYYSSKNGYSGDQINFIMSGVLAPIFCLPGMVGNILAVMVWNRPAMTSSTGRYLTAQALSDFAVLFFYFVNDCFQAWELPIVFEAPYGYYYSYVGYPINYFFVVLHIWSTVGVTIDLCLMVCCVLKAKTFCNTHVANTYILVLAVLAFLINIPHFFNYRPVDDIPSSSRQPTTNHTYNNNTATNTTTTPDNKCRTMSFALTDFGSDDRGKYYKLGVHCALLIILPWIATFAMNVKIIHKIVRSNQRMADNKNSQSVKNSKQTEAQITRVLLGVSISFLVSIGTLCTVQCLWMMEPTELDRDMVISSYMFAKTCFVFNATSHFFFYCILGKRFRAELGKMLCLESLRKRNSSSLFLTTKTHSSENTNYSATPE